VRVFRQVADMVDRFVDFDRSLADQGAMTELIACYVLGTYFLPAYEAQVNQAATLVGRNLEPWRATLAVALWLDEQGVSGLFKRMDRLSVAYQLRLFEKPPEQRFSLAGTAQGEREVLDMLSEPALTDSVQSAYNLTHTCAFQENRSCPSSRCSTAS
jgi:hypothetical protein